jgi:type II secretory pathway pseudopilin PulG
MAASGKETSKMKKITTKFSETTGTLLKKLRNNEGFTLNEMVVSICIMTILISMLVPRIRGYIKEAQYVHDVYAAKTLYDAIELALLDPDIYYETQKSLTKNFTQYNAKKIYDINSASYITIPSKYTNFLRTRLKETGTTEVYNPYRQSSLVTVNGKKTVKAQKGFEGISKAADAINEIIGDSRNLGSFMDVRFWDSKANSKKWQVTDQFVIVANPSDPRDIAVYLGSSKGKNENGIIMKLYPTDDSRKLDFSYVQIVK